MNTDFDHVLSMIAFALKLLLWSLLLHMDAVIRRCFCVTNKQLSPPGRGLVSVGFMLRFDE